MTDCERPHPVRWPVRVFPGVLSGLVVCVPYRDRNPAAARLHPVLSLVMLATVTAGFLTAAVVAGDALPADPLVHG